MGIHRSMDLMDDPSGVLPRTHGPGYVLVNHTEHPHGSHIVQAADTLCMTPLHPLLAGLLLVVEDVVLHAYY